MFAPQLGVCVAHSQHPRRKTLLNSISALGASPQMENAGPPSVHGRYDAKIFPACVAETFPQLEPLHSEIAPLNDGASASWTHRVLAGMPGNVPHVYEREPRGTAESDSPL